MKIHSGTSSFNLRKILENNVKHQMLMIMNDDPAGAKSFDSRIQLNIK